MLVGKLPSADGMTWGKWNFGVQRTRVWGGFIDKEVARGSRLSNTTSCHPVS